MNPVTTIRPGLLVSLKTSVVGGITYEKRDLTTDKEVAEGVQVARWETERTITDAKEHEEATKVRGRVRSIIGSVCAKSAFGMLCPESNESALLNAISEARELAERFNESAKITRVQLYVIAGKVSPSDAEAVRAIKSEMADLMATMDSGLKNLDVKAVREAANRARSIGQMLNTSTQETVKKAIDAAREAARKIVKAGETGAVEIDQQTMRALAESRLAFLDIADEAETAPTIAPIETTAHAIDLEPEEDDDESSEAAQIDLPPPALSAAPMLDL